MAVHRFRYSRLVMSALLTIAILVGCTMPGPAPLPAPSPDLIASTPVPAALPALDQDILRLPLAFRYEMTLRPAATPEGEQTVIAGAYREGAWQQTSISGAHSPEELIVARDLTSGSVHSFTRAGSDSAWSRWPGTGFDAGYGLASPFAVLRLYPIADASASAETDVTIEAPEPVSRVQTTFTPETIARLLTASAAAVSSDAETRSSLEAQLSALLAPQTITYWVSESGRVYQAAATLLTVGQDGAPAPWLEVTWSYSDYDDPAIAVAAPSEYTDISESVAPAAEAEDVRGPGIDPAATLRIRVFENQGVLAQAATVTVFPTGSEQAAAELASADAQFVLAPGTYDVLVRAANAEQRLDGVVVPEEGLASRDVLFDFGELIVTVLDNGELPQVDIMVYPTGQRETWTDFRSENPATMRVPAGVYDIELSLPDLSGTRSVNGIEVKGGETVSQTIDIVR